MSVSWLPRSPAWLAQFGFSHSAAVGEVDEVRRDALALLVTTLVALVFYVVPWAFVYVPALILLAYLGWHRPDITVMLPLMFSPFVMDPKHLRGSLAPTESEVFLLLTVAIIAIHVAFRPRTVNLNWKTTSESPFLLPLLLFVVAASISTFFAADQHHAIQAWRQRVFEPCMYFLLLLLLLSRKSQWWLLTAAFIVSGFAVGIIALGQLVTNRGLSLVPGTTFHRVEALYGSPDNLGLLYDRVLALGFAVLVMSRPTVRRILWTFPLAAVFLCVLFFTSSRGAWAGVGVALLFVLTLRYSWGKWVALCCLVIGIGGIAVKGQSIARAFRSGHSHTVQRRTDIYRSAGHMLKDHWLVGVGPDNFLHYYAPRHQLYIQCAHGLGYMEPEASQEPCESHPHNEILDFWLSSGLLGLAAFVWLEVAFWRSAVKGYQLTRGTKEVTLVVGSMAAMIGMLVHGMVDNSYFLVDLALIFWYLCAMISFFTPVLNFRGSTSRFPPSLPPSQGSSPGQSGGMS